MEKHYDIKTQLRNKFALHMLRVDLPSDFIETTNKYIDEELIPFEELILKVKTIAGSNTDIRIFLRADTTINYGEVMKVLGALNTSGFLKIALVTKKPS